jgi:LEA14-like dessication related protein
MAFDYGWALMREAVPTGERLRCGLAHSRRAWLLLAAGLLVQAAACRKPEAPSIRPHLARVTGVSAAGVELEVQLDVSNPNSFPLAAEQVKGTLYLSGGQKLGEGVAHPRSPIAARGSSVVSSQVNVGWADLGAILPLLVSQRVPYELRGDVTLGGRSINVTLPFTFKGELDRTELLRAGMRGF